MKQASDLTSSDVNGFSSHRALHLTNWWSCRISWGSIACFRNWRIHLKRKPCHVKTLPSWININLLIGGLLQLSHNYSLDFFPARKASVWSSWYNRGKLEKTMAGLLEAKKSTVFLTRHKEMQVIEQVEFLTNHSRRITYRSWRAAVANPALVYSWRWIWL